jgi:hypothetical protein
VVKIFLFFEIYFLGGWGKGQATARTNTGVLRCAQDDGFKAVERATTTAKANTEILSFAQNDDVMGRAGGDGSSGW